MWETIHSHLEWVWETVLRTGSDGVTESRRAWIWNPCHCVDVDRRGTGSEEWQAEHLVSVAPLHSHTHGEKRGLSQLQAV